MITTFAFTADAAGDRIVLCEPAPVRSHPFLVLAASGGAPFVVARPQPTGTPFRLESSKTAGGARDVAARQPYLDALRAIGKLHELPQGWDGDGAAPPSILAVQRATEIVGRLDVLPDETDPDAIGGIALWFYSRGGERRVMLGVRNDGRIAVCAYEPDSPIPNVRIVPDAASAVILARAALARP